MKIYWILINYNSNVDIHNIITNVKFKDVRFIVVDNSLNFSTNSNIKIIEPQNNLGYIGGFQLVLKNIDYHEGDIIIFSNSDIDPIFDLSTIEKLDYGKCYIPDITTINGKKQNPHFVSRPSAFKFIVLYLFTLNHNIFNLYRKFTKFLSFVKKNKTWNINDETKVYAGHGSMYIFNTKVIFQLKSKEFNFLFGEEIHIAEHLRLYNIDTVFKKDIKIIHNEHSSTSKIGKNISKYYNESYKTILKSYYLNAPNHPRP